MTDKRYHAHTSLINEDKVHDKICHRFMNFSETVEHMNMYYQKYTALKKENEQLKSVLLGVINRLYYSENAMIWEMSSHISEDEIELKEEFKKEFGKYGWEE